jgi:putative transposase
MVAYRRNRLAGAYYFFTITLRDRRATTLTDHIGLLRAAYSRVQSERPFTTVAIVVLPDHLHAVWTLPELDTDYSTRWQLIKTHFSRTVRRQTKWPSTVKIWQSRFWEHTVYDDNDLDNHLAYIHHNPVKHGLVERACDWPHSSFHRFEERGKIARDWVAPPSVQDIDLEDQARSSPRK